jgi:hypothetical protein
MINLRLLSVLFTSMMFASSLGYAEIYKWKDVEGKLRYSDVPPKSDVKYEVLNKKKESRAPEANKPMSNEVKLAKSLEANSLGKNAKEVTGIENKGYEKIKENAAKTTKAPAVDDGDMVAMNAENCRAAQSNYALYNNGGRIKQVNAKGEVVFLDNAEIAGAKANAQKDIDKFCNG